MIQRDTNILERTGASPNDQDDDGLAHIVMKRDQMRGYVSGQPIKALCGKVWIPSRDYQGLPICPRCSKERERLLAGMGNRN
jgi:hypothetical protein